MSIHPDDWPGVADDDEPVPREVVEHHARDNHTLRMMLKNGGNVTRAGYIISDGIDTDPETGELSSDLPSCFQYREGARRRG